MLLKTLFKNPIPLDEADMALLRANEFAISEDKIGAYLPHEERVNKEIMKYEGFYVAIYNWEAYYPMGFSDMESYGQNLEEDFKTLEEAILYLKRK